MNLRNCFPVCLLVVVLLTAACSGEEAPSSGSGEPARVLPPAVRVENPESDAPDGFVSVSAGWNYSCGLRVQGEVECWFWGEPFRPSGEYFHDQVGEFYRIDWTGPPSTEAPGGEFVAVDAGREAACGLRPGGMVECWGPNPLAEVSPPGGEFVSVSVGLEHACGVRPDAGVECWGLSEKRMGAGVPSGGEFAMIAAGRDYVCGLRSGGEVECWGLDYSEGAEPPGGIFESISGDGGVVCGLRSGGELECWRDLPADYDPVSSPREALRMVSPGKGLYACGLRLEGETVCWHHYYNGEQVPYPQDVEFVSVAAGAYVACGLSSEGEELCWSMQSGSSLPREGNGKFKVLSLGYHHYCGLRVDGEVECWGSDEFGEASPPGGRFEAISSGFHFSCGLRSGGEVQCWGRDELGESSPPEGVFEQVATSEGFACGLRPSGSVECWGGDHQVLQSKAADPQEILVFVDAGWGGHSGVKSWVNRPYDPDRPLSRADFLPFSRDWGYSCGLRDNGTLFCWGDNGRLSYRGGGLNFDGEDHPVLSPPGGVFADVGVGRHQACALRSTGEVECWGALPVREADGNYYSSRYEPGSYSYGEDSPRDSRFASLAVGGWHACALDTSGVVECWALEDGAPLAAGEGFDKSAVYESISAGYYHTCGVRSDGGVDCWGAFDDLY